MHRRVFRTIGLYLRNLPGHADRLRYLADLQRDIAGGHALIGADHHVVPYEGLEPLVLHPQVVGPGCMAIMLNAPTSFATVFRVSDVRELVMVTLAPAMTWPEGSTTVPLSVPVIVIWAESSPKNIVANNTTHHMGRVLVFNMESPHKRCAGLSVLSWVELILLTDRCQS